MKALESVDARKVLGVTIQSYLKWDLHINDVVAKASKRLQILRVARNCKNRKKLLQRPKVAQRLLGQAYLGGINIVIGHKYRNLYGNVIIVWTSSYVKMFTSPSYPRSQLGLPVGKCDFSNIITRSNTLRSLLRVVL